MAISHYLDSGSLLQILQSSIEDSSIGLELFDLFVMLLPDSFQVDLVFRAQCLQELDRLFIFGSRRDYPRYNSRGMNVNQ